MKKVLRTLIACSVILTLVLGMASSSFAATTSNTKVRKEITKNYTMNEKRGVYELHSKSIYNYTYNKSGLNTKSVGTFYNYTVKKVDGKWKTVCLGKDPDVDKVTWTYDSKKRIKTSTVHYPNSKTKFTYKYKKKDGKKYVTIESYGSKRTEIYNSKGLLISETDRIDGKITDKTTYKYDSKGNLTKRVSKDYQSNYTTTDTYKNYYTSDGILEKVVEKNNPQYLYSKTITYYHTEGKAKGLQKSQTLTVIAGGEVHSDTTYKFDSKGRMTKMTFENARCKTVTTYKY